MITESKNVVSWKGPIRTMEPNSELHRTPQRSHNVFETRYYNNKDYQVLHEDNKRYSTYCL